MNGFNNMRRVVAQRIFATALVAAIATSGAGLLSPAARAVDYAFVQRNLVSDQPGVAAFTDPNLVNPWGIAMSPTSFFWISNNASNTSTLYNGAGTPSPATPLVVNVPGGPTGQVFNTGVAAGAFGGNSFLFSTESGQIRGWRGALSPNSEVLFDSSSSNANYKGLAVSSILGTTYLYVADFNNARIDVFSSTGNTSPIVGNFLDPSVPAGFVPFNVQHFGAFIYVTYAFKANPGDTDETAGPGLGYVSVFDLLGGYVMSIGAGAPLNAPWGLAIAPNSFGNYAGDLLVGNFGDGTINVYNATDGGWLAVLRGLDRDPLAIDGLWGLAFGNGANAGSTNTLYFTAGPDDETRGIFGSIEAVAVPEPSTYFAGATLLAACGIFWFRRQRRARA